MTMDNRSINIIAEGAESLACGLQIAWPNAIGGKATHYKTIKAGVKETYYVEPASERWRPNVEHQTLGQLWVSSYVEEIAMDDGTDSLILLWHDEHKSFPLPYPLDFKGALHFIEGWLANADYGRQPDHDGDDGRGFRLFTDGWGHVVGHHYAIVGVQPAWAMYGK